MKSTFTILITSKNRKNNLAFTLAKINYLVSNSNVEIVVFDDGSSDGTADYAKENVPNIQLQRNPVFKGYIFCRNKMLNETNVDYSFLNIILILKPKKSIGINL